MRTYLWISLLWSLSAIAMPVHALNCVAEAWAAQQAPGPRIVTPVEFRGTGCPTATSLPVTCEMDEADNRLDLKMAFLEFSLSASLGEQTKDCYVKVTIESPNPVRYALRKAWFEGSANLSTNERMVLDVDFGIVGTPKAYYESMHYEVAGPWGFVGGSDGSWYAAKEPQGPQWSACSTRHQVELQVTGTLHARPDRESPSTMILNTANIRQGPPGVEQGPAVAVVASQCSR